TTMGPVYPFANMFEEMKSQEVDFWGITKTHKVEGYDFGYNPYGYLPEHIQSYFIVYRKSLVQSPDLQRYWEKMPEIVSYNQSVGLYESAFTKMFEDKGFRWDVYVNTDDFEGVTDQPLMFYPYKLIRDRKCPIFKRRSFFHNYHDMLYHTTGQSTILLYNYLI
ncbi:rhamnan synthesis F family protein, partial [Bacillus altitudinis]|uniref:rhamnan synthesis F family protein n=1 Tax=Bacillus altitudinis TaxID=293387 RepID=UPI003314D618